MAEIMDKDTKKKEIQATINALNKQFGKSSTDTNPIVFLASDRGDLLQTTYEPTGILELDKELGGGFPHKTIVGIHGDAGAGKTSLALTLAARLTQQGKYVLYLNTEPPFAENTANMVGVDREYFIYQEPKDYAEQVIDNIETFMFDQKERTAKNLIDLVIVDSINNLVSKKAIDKLEKDGAEGQTMATRAGMIDSFLSRVQGRGLLREGCIMILIIQDRANLDAGTHPGAPKTVQSGGYSLRYNPKVLLKLQKKSLYKVVNGKNKAYGHQVIFTIEKNNISGLPGKGEYTVIYGEGIDDLMTLILNAVDWGYIVKKGKSVHEIYLEDGDYSILGASAGLKATLANSSDLKNKLRAQIAKGKPKIAPVPSGVLREVVLDDTSEPEGDEIEE